MRALVAPDKFKGTLSAREVATAIARGLQRGGVDEVECLPVADGGEGTIEALLAARGGRIIRCEVRDPLGQSRTAAFAILADKRTGVVEMAATSGLGLVPWERRDPLRATSYGTGELIRAAIDCGAAHLIVGVGGSATTDGGRGALEALGARFADGTVDLDPLRRGLEGVGLTIAADVTNPLCGPSGAARVFAPQKGADPMQVEQLERRLEEWAALAARTTGRDPSAEPMAGAAGGLAGGLWAFAGAELRSGADLVLDELNFDRRARAADAVVTGEGRLDEQTLGGKAVARIAERCQRCGVPCLAIVGIAAIDPAALRLERVVEATAGQEAAGPQDLGEAAERLGLNFTGRRGA